MHETTDDLQRLQSLLDRSYEAAGAHLLSIVTPERRLTVDQIVGLLVGVQVLALATVTADGRPLVGPVDGLFYRGSFWFGSSPDSVRFRHIARRPAVSATHTRGERLAVTVHGRAVRVYAATADDGGFRSLCVDTYGEGWDGWGEAAVYARIDPQRMFAFGFPEAAPGD